MPWGLVLISLMDSPFKLIAENKTWEAALNFCRDHHTHLASIVSEEHQAWAELEAANATSPFVWLGLRYTCTLEFWFWVQDIRVDFTHWDQNNRMGDCDMSGAMENQENHLWSSQPATSTFNFICTI
ncbi:Snaclec agglucetin subunit beta-1 [Liparis tanakae]|uniref:Snaclec agglucetin subunit beta-1 n=1 Tax=Liparis tanakae TaxID=230148 RepID=A0A4Z2F5X1_9TELE|nr:Snaclec agglucetin subunit beta-1 [Liparis tanakae]